LKKGQRLGVEVIGTRLQTQNVYDPHLTIAKADGTISRRSTTARSHARTPSPVSSRLKTESTF
jgi:hypothetical protein